MEPALYRVEALDVRDKLLVVTVEDRYADQETMLNVRKSLERLLPKEELGYTRLLILRNGVNIEALSDEQLAAGGFQRIPQRESFTGCGCRTGEDCERCKGSRVKSS